MAITKNQFLDIDIKNKEREIAKLSDEIGDIRRRMKDKKKLLRKIKQKRG